MSGQITGRTLPTTHLVANGPGQNHLPASVTPIDRYNNGALVTEAHAPRIKTAVDVAGAGITYVGTAAPGTALSDPYWRLQRITVAGTITLTEYALTPATAASPETYGAFDKVWDDRASYTYA